MLSFIVLHTLVSLGGTSFFFEWYAVHRDLHSFPTRRSSDLSMLPLWSPCSTLTLSASLMRRSGLRRDRKSTRLNSSHANISYAVFCLKKKIVEHINHRVAVMYLGRIVELPTRRALFAHPQQP